MTRRALSMILVLLLSGGPAGAQVALPLGVTSPLGLGVGAPVSETGIPMGATELATPGISPMATDATAAPATFDGGGQTPTTTSPAAADLSLANPASSSSSPIGVDSTMAVARPGIPLGSVELGGGGLSPLPGPTNVAVPMATPATPLVTSMPVATMATAPAAAPSIVGPIMPTFPAGRARAPGGR